MSKRKASQGRTKYADKNNKNYLDELETLVNENELEIALKVVKLFSEHPELADPFKFPKGSRLYSNRINFKRHCMRWLKPGKLPSTKVVRIGSCSLYFLFIFILALLSLSRLKPSPGKRTANASMAEVSRLNNTCNVCVRLFTAAISQVSVDSAVFRHSPSSR
jgi:hypothetical protein